MTEKTLEELAMELAIASLDEVDPGFFDRIITDSKAEQIHVEMLSRFEPYQVHRAIKRAKELVTMVIPDQGDDDDATL